MKDVGLLKEYGVEVDNALATWGDIESYNDGLKEYYDELIDKVKQLESYKNNHDYENYGILAHSLKSESKYFGFMSDANVFLEHELKGKESDGVYIDEHFKELVDTANRIYDLLSNYFTGEGNL